MPFKTLLTNLVETVPGATGAILADWEGEAVEQHYQGDPYEIKVTAAHWGILLARLKELHSKYGAGDVQESLITTDQEQAIIGAIGDDYALVMTMTRDALPFLALRNFREAAGLMAKEIY